MMFLWNNDLFSRIQNSIWLGFNQGIYNTGRFILENKQLSRWPFIKVKQRPWWIFCELATLCSFNTVKTKIWYQMALLLLCLVLFLINEARCCQKNPLAAQKVDLWSSDALVALGSEGPWFDTCLGRTFDFSLFKILQKNQE